MWRAITHDNNPQNNQHVRKTSYEITDRKRIRIRIAGAQKQRLKTKILKYYNWGWKLNSNRLFETCPDISTPLINSIDNSTNN